MKEYLLLRNNKQSGPYSLDELQQMGLKAFDLIWIDKKSSAWRYPSEIKEMAAFAPSPENVETNIASHTGQKVVSITTAVSKAGSNDPNVYRQPAIETAEHYASHVVAFKPTVNKTRIQTIKSSTSRNIVQVQVRTEEAQPVHAAAFTETKTETNTNGHTITPEHNNIFKPVKHNTYQPAPMWDNMAITASGNQYISDNKLELAVLIIGAISLLAIVFLLVTSPY